MGAVLLRRLYTSSFEEFWPEFPDDAKATIKHEMLATVQQEPIALLKKKFCECTAEFARNMIGTSNFFTLFKWIIRCNKKAIRSELCIHVNLTKLRIEICERIKKIFSDDDGNNTWPDVLNFMFKCANDPDPTLREASLTIFRY